MYLRHFGTQSVRPGRPELPDFGSSPSSVDLGDLDVLARKGQNRVMSKKVLLAFLAIKEAERIGLEISDEEIEVDLGCAADRVKDCTIGKLRSIGWSVRA